MSLILCLMLSLQTKALAVNLSKWNFRPVIRPRKANYMRRLQIKNAFNPITVSESHKAD